MKDMHCIFCKQICRGRATGKNEYERWNGGFMHTRCIGPYKTERAKLYYPNSGTRRDRRPKDPAKRKIWNHTSYIRRRYGTV